jgi:hypothetical protein
VPRRLPPTRLGPRRDPPDRAPTEEPLQTGDDKLPAGKLSTP